MEPLIEDINEKVARRGFVLWDGQLLRTPISLGEGIEVIFEGHTAFDASERRDWGPDQREYFDLDSPYQMAEESGAYTQSHLMTRVLEPYLFPEERIAAIVNGEKDNYYFYCPCHHAHVVYTTCHRLVCMSCGAMHVVLRRGLPFRPKRLLTAEDWAEHFDEDGSRRDEELELSVVDFCDVETADTIWTTHQWLEAKHRFVFFARSPPDVVEKAIRGTEADPSIMMEAGFVPVATPPPPAHQVSPQSIDVDLLENSAHSLAEGVEAYLAARNSSDRLLQALPALFRAVELLLKAKLEGLDSGGLADRPNTASVLERLASRGVSLSSGDRRTVDRLRRLRNALQHGTARFNHRAGLSACRDALVFIDRFTQAELGLWIGDAISSESWHRILAIPEIGATAERVMEGLLEPIRRQPGATISACPRCKRNALVRPHPATGEACLYCLHVPLSG